MLTHPVMDYVITPMLVLIAQAVFPLEHRQTDTHNNRCNW